MGNKWTVIDTISYLMLFSVAARMVPYYLETDHRWAVSGFLLVFLILFTLARFLLFRKPVQIIPYFLAQTAICLILILLIPSYDGPQDYFVMLLLPLCIQAMWQLPRRTGSIWVVIFSVMMVFSMILFYQLNEGTWEGIGYGLTYVAGGILISVFSSVTLQAQEARKKAEILNNELHTANQKLQAYSQQVEQLAAAEERARLARDLHDSVSQTIFSMTLTAQAARILFDRDPDRVPGQLDHLQALARNALDEMRSLIQHLRPLSLTQEGLAACLRRHVQERKKQDGLDVELTISGSRSLPPAVEEALFRVVQEALNNVVKHAGVNKAHVNLELDRDPIVLCIQDNGTGFSPGTVQPQPGHLGLSSMSERIESLGGRLIIDSSPGSGTRVCVYDIRAEELEHA